MYSRNALFAVAVALSGAAMMAACGGGETATKAQQASAGDSSRTPWGHPNLQGTWVRYGNTSLQRPAQYGTREFFTAEELAENEKRANEVRPNPVGEEFKPRKLQPGDDGYFSNRDPTNTEAHPNRFWSGGTPDNPDGRKGPRLVSKRTSQIIDPPDGQLPAYTPELLKRWEEREATRQGRTEADTPEDRNFEERCIPSAVDVIPLGSSVDRYIVQTPDYIFMYIEGGLGYSVPRIIPLDGRPALPASMGQYLGEARGRWEGETLVVETTNFDKQDGGPQLASHRGLFPRSHAHGYAGDGKTLHLTERFTRLPDGTLEYRYTVDDPKVYVKPFTAVLTMLQDNDHMMFEMGCHEGNYGIPGALAGARKQEAVAFAEAVGNASDRKNQIRMEREKLQKWQAANAATGTTGTKY